MSGLKVVIMMLCPVHRVTAPGEPSACFVCWGWPQAIARAAPTGTWGRFLWSCSVKAQIYLFYHSLCRWLYCYSMLSGIAPKWKDVKEWLHRHYWEAVWFSHLLFWQEQESTVSKKYSVHFPCVYMEILFFFLIPNLVFIINL